MIDHAENRFFVSGNDARRQNDGVVFVDAHQPVIIDGDARKRGHRLGLRPAREHHEALWIEAANVLRAHDAAVGNAQLVEAVRDLDVVHHAAPDEPDLAPHAARDIDHLLNAVHRAREARDDNFFGRRAEKLFEAHHHRALGGREAGALDVGAVAEEREHALLPVARERVQVERFAIDGSRIDLEIAGVDDDADRRAHRERDAIDRAVRDVQILDLEWAERGRFAGRDFVQLGRIEQAVLFQFFPHQRERELRAVYRHVEVAENVGDRADVVFVRVREDDRAHHALVLLQVGDVGDDDVDAEQFLLGKHQAGVDHDDVVAAAKSEHVHAELAQSAERNGPQRRICAQIVFCPRTSGNIVSQRDGGWCVSGT